VCKKLLFFQANGTAGFGGLNFVALALVGKDIVFRFIIKYTLVPLGQFNTNYIIFRNVEIFKKYFFQIKKYIVKENSGYLRIVHLLKWSR